MPTIGPLKLTARLLCGGEIAMGPGKADLLEAIDREGSISAAGRALGMSYRRAWVLVDVMNRCWSGRLVEATIGGHQQGARLTELGRRVLSDYRALEARIAEAAEAPMRALSAELLPDPRVLERRAAKQSA